MKASTTFACAVLGAVLMLPAQSAAQDPQTPPSQPPAQQQQPTPQQPTAQQSQQTAGDEQAARQRLTDARNTLSEMTQLPAASQLSGDARTQVSELISNFNELISADRNWKASYEKVSSNLAMLLGPENVAPAPPATGTPGAVGTAGTIELDPAIREKLVELRLQLKEFEKAATGTADDAASSATSSPMTTPPSSTSPTSPTYPSTPPAGMPETTPATEAPASAQGPGNAEIARHIAAIETMLKSEDDSGGITLTKTQLEQLRIHWAALKASIR